MSYVVMSKEQSHDLTILPSSCPILLSNQYSVLLSANHFV